MMCDKYALCEHCYKDGIDECPYDHMGDGTAYCGEFICTEDDCRRTNCIDEERGYYD